MKWSANEPWLRHFLVVLTVIPEGKPVKRSLYILTCVGCMRSSALLSLEFEENRQTEG